MLLMIAAVILVLWLFGLVALPAAGAWSTCCSSSRSSSSSRTSSAWADRPRRL